MLILGKLHIMDECKFPPAHGGREWADAKIFAKCTCW